MTQFSKIIAAAALGLAFAASADAAPAGSAPSPLAVAISAGHVGEQADGYLGVRGTVSPAIHQAVEAINIKRRAAFTQLAAQKNVTVQEVAASVGCQTLSTRVGPDEAYLLRDGVWRTRQGSTPIALPDYCGG